jgi:hypothetical protein
MHLASARGEGFRYRKEKLGKGCAISLMGAPPGIGRFLRLGSDNRDKWG